MREAVVVMQRELKSYFLSPIAYVFGALFLLLFHLFIVPRMLQHGQVAWMLEFFRYLPLVFVLFLPALTMRLWAEERKLGTLELLMTFPVTVPQLIAGKFLAAMIYLTVILALTLGIPVSLWIFGNLDWGPVICAYVAALLMAAAYVSVGLFFSSLTRDQIVALLLALVALMTLYFMGSPEFLAQLHSFLPVWLVEIIGGISLYKYFASIARGVLDTRDLVYYVVFCGFWLYLNALVLQGRRLKG